MIRLREGAKLPKIVRYRCPENLLSEFKRYIQEMLDKGYISPGESEFSSPILIIKKPGINEDGTCKGYRFVSDLRALNKVVAPMQHYLPDITLISRSCVH